MELTDEQARKLLSQQFAGVSQSVRKRNPHIYGQPQIRIDTNPPVYENLTPAKRMRQDTKERLNKLETAFLNECLKYQFGDSEIRSQAMRFELANGVWYKPDFIVFIGGLDSQDRTPRAFEVKGPKSWRGGFENLKLAARIWPMFRWTLVWKVNGKWKEQRVLS